MTLSAEFIADLYRRYSEDPTSLDTSWSAFFDGIDGAALVSGGTAAGRASEIDPHRTALLLGRLIESYRARGHLRARLDPLGLAATKPDGELLLDRLALESGSSAVAPALNGELGLATATLRRVLDRLEEVYCGTIGFDIMQVGDGAAREWLRSAAETGWGAPTAATRRAGAQRLIEADELEQFMHRRFQGKKRFGVEGAESLLSWLWAMLEESVALGVRSVMVGGTARGRLNQMVGFCGKPLHVMFAEFYGTPPFPEGVRASGDVSYHLGHAAEHDVGGTTVRIEYCHNPSHLEAIDGVALGRVRALQRRLDDPSAVLGLMVHTDAAFAGQGVVAEMLQLSALPAYSTGGTIHVVINNQVGFTTDPSNGRTSHHCTDVAKAIGAPVLHVNGDDVDAVLRTARIAAAYRRRFGRDIVVDLVCYRRRGHNEVDEPTFTQPAMYRRIAELPPVRQSYLARLDREGAFAAADAEAFAADCRDRLEQAYAASKTYRPNRSASPPPARAVPPTTGVPLADLGRIGKAISTAPAGMEINPKVERVLGERLEALDAGQGIGWPLAEALAYATLAADGIGIRLSGQDTPRGAFSHRHFILHDQRDGRGVSIFDAVMAGRTDCEVIASPLSEYATLAFEYGFTLDASDSLVVWEAQFGDFVNTAQVVIDQFISSGEDKWLQQSGLTMLLPHGLEGQGPEHSSARIERFLQMCAGGNMTVANCSTPANYFHLLRRQATGPRRPLVIFTPKSLLRHRAVVSTLAEMGPGTAFRPVLGPEPDRRFERIVLCSGKIYWDLAAAIATESGDRVGLVRLEQLHPFPDEALEAALQPHAGATMVWCQEEPENMGPWSHVDRRIEAVLRRIGCRSAWPAYVGRPENPSPAIGTTDQHNADQARIVAQALGG